MFILVREYFILFFLYSVMGWIAEVFYAFLFKNKLTNRGFLVGPYCPIYGIGALLIIILLSKYKSYPFGLFVLAMVICSILEYYTGYIMEKLFNARWWDYSNTKFNINGRVCLNTMIPFGLFACLVIYIINPFLLNVIAKVPDIYLNIFFIIFLIILIADLIISFNVVNSFKNTITKITLEDRTDDINKYIKNLLLQKSVFYRRLIMAFPKISAIIRVKNNN